MVRLRLLHMFSRWCDVQVMMWLRQGSMRRRRSMFWKFVGSCEVLEQGDRLGGRQEDVGSLPDNGRCIASCAAACVNAFQLVLGS